MVASNTHGIQFDNMDLAADPGQDFYRYANGAYLDKMEIPAAYPRWGTFLVLREQSLETVHSILQKAAADTTAKSNSNDRKIGDLYHSGMDEVKIEEAGIAALASELKRIARVRTPGQLADVVAHLHLCGPNVLFAFYVSPDLKNSSTVIANASQGGLGLPDREYYLAEDARSIEIRQKYRAHIGSMCVLLGDSLQDAQEAADAILAIETDLATASLKKEEMRDPENRYHKMSVAEWQALFPQFPVKRYLAQLGVKKLQDLNVGQPDFFRAVGAVLSRYSMEELRAYLRWHLLRVTAKYLSSEFVNLAFEFYGKTLQGTKELQPRWKRVVATVDECLGEAVGEVYVREHFPAEAKARMLQLVANVTEEVRASIVAAAWMSETTRKNALTKLGTFKTKIGYPDKWTDYRSLKIDRCSYVGNVLRANTFATKQDLAKIGKPVDRSEWHMYPQTVNAYYSPQLNEIVFPAAILQPPFFDVLADDASNYGGIGAVIAHEITHGFDDKGCKFDEQGNLNNWWTDEDKVEFARRMALIKDQYSAFQIETGEHLSGELVCGEAAADLGGVSLAYRALQKALKKDKPQDKDAHGFTPEQRFFIAFAQIWAGKERPEFAQLQVKTDPHPMGRFRTNGTLANVPEFPIAFGLPDDCPMMLPPDKRCQLW
jgi:putative endopeptidase